MALRKISMQAVNMAVDACTPECRDEVQRILYSQIGARIPQPPPEPGEPLASHHGGPKVTAEPEPEPTIAEAAADAVDDEPETAESNVTAEGADAEDSEPDDEPAA